MIQWSRPHNPRNLVRHPRHAHGLARAEQRHRVGQLAQRLGRPELVNYARAGLTSISRGAPPEAQPHEDDPHVAARA
jgi:hypothetical protein